MNVRAVAVVVALLFVAAIGYVLYRNLALNMGYTTQLTLDVGFAAWKFEQPQPVLYLLLSAFSAGFLAAMTWFGLRSAALSRRVRQLEREAALGGTGYGSRSSSTGTATAASSNQGASERSEWR